ncbi:hypothetical protein [Cardinium endosymbiont of Nabis limbatus]|uniref:hypothetical protein n=1 Tax=Cardinium endosymbiont of Nabis limbatus TaxID=3066217 RepID=UPI003AF3FE93
MQSALKIRILGAIVAHTWFGITAIGANPHSNLPVSRLLQEEKADPPLESDHPSLAEDGVQMEKEALPLVKVAHRDVMDLLYLYLLPKSIDIPHYVPFIQQVGVRINWLECLRNLWSNEKKSYGGGVDFHFSGPIQLSFDIGYAAYHPKDIIHPNELKYKSKGGYGVVALLYVMPLNQLNNAYFGVAYGQSQFEFIAYDAHIAPSSNRLAVGWGKLVGGSELRLFPQIYGGMQVGVGHLLHAQKNNDRRISNYFVPGYGRMVNKVMFDMTFYLKWSIFFLEKKIVI